MSNKTRKRLWPASLVMAVAIIGVVAAFLVMASSPGNTQAHTGETGAAHCEGLNDFLRDLHDASAGDHTCDDPPQPPENNAPAVGASIDNRTVGADGTITVDVSGAFTDADDDTLTYSAMSSDTGVAMASVTGSMVTVTGVAAGTASITVTATDPSGAEAQQVFVVTVRDPAEDMITSDTTTSSGSPELKLTIASLPMDMAVGSSIVVYLEDDYQEPGSIPMSSVYLAAEDPTTPATGNGSRVYVTSPVKVKTGAYFDEDKKDIAIRVLVPDMCTTDTVACQGANGLDAGQKVTLVIESDSGIKNPSEAGTHSVSYELLGSTDPIPSASVERGRNDARRAADKAAGVDPGEGQERVLKTVAKISLSDVDNSRGYEMTVTGSGFNDGTTAAVYVLAYSEKPTCEMIIDMGTQVGGAIVGSDDKVAVTFEVTAPTFKPGNVNYICMVDGEGRASTTDVEDFNLEPSIKVVPSSVSSGDTVNVFAQDFPANAGGFVELKIASKPIVTLREAGIRSDGSGEVTFKVPGGFEGVLRIDAKWGSVNEFSKITITGAELIASKTEVLPNESIIINGNGFGSQTCIPFENIRLDNVPFKVHPDSASDLCDGKSVSVSNSGQFVATVILWPDSSGSNPALIPGVHKLSVEDTSGFGSDVSLTIPEPTIKVTPDVAGPRDYITITGENWPVDNLDNSIRDQVVVEVDDFGEGRSYSLYADSVGRFTQEYRVHRKVAIPDTVQVKATFASELVKIGSFSVPASTIEVTPGEAQPGDTLSLSATNMPVYTKVLYVEVGGTRQIHEGVNTDRDGNVSVDNVLVPGLDPGTYSVVIAVGERDNPTIAIGEVDVLAESAAAGAPSELPGAVEELGDNLAAIFHFDDVGKVWSFYDPRPEFAELNTLTEMVNGEAYWILVNETVEDVVLNNKVRSLTCRGDDCWNLEVW